MFVLSPIIGLALLTAVGSPLAFSTTIELHPLLFANTATGNLNGLDISNHVLPINDFLPEHRGSGISILNHLSVGWWSELRAVREKGRKSTKTKNRPLTLGLACCEIAHDGMQDRQPTDSDVAAFRYGATSRPKKIQMRRRGKDLHNFLQREARCLIAACREISF